jgi:hypothetical protein
MPFVSVPDAQERAPEIRAPNLHRPEGKIAISKWDAEAREAQRAGEDRASVFAVELAEADLGELARERLVGGGGAGHYGDMSGRGLSVA